MKKKYKRTKIFGIVAGSVTLLLVVANILALGPLSQVVAMRFGGKRPIYKDGTESSYVYDTESKAAAEENAADVNLATCEEGFTLLKNDGTLPINVKAGAAKVSVFGKNSVDLVYGSSGSSASDMSDASTIYDSLKEAGFETNPTLQSFYKDSKASGSGRSENSSDLDNGNEVSMSTGETPYSSYTDAVKASYAEYSDAAIIVISRSGGEGFDLPKEGTNGRHYLELDDNEKEMIQNVTASFEKVILIVNSNNAMELGFVEDGSLGKINACIWTGAPGKNGIMALGEILNGTVNPSGKLSDTYARDFTKNPSYNNFGYSDNVYDLKDTDGSSYWFADYEEDVYVGYRYYETAWYESTQGNYDGFSYADEVVYPFGYGLSYTSFSWEITDASSLINKTINEDGTFDIKVKVTNTGSVAGKDVVELYCSTPYTAGGIEKAYKNLCGYEKTPMLYPESQASKNKPNSCELTLKFSLYDVASYDYSDANGNGFAGYELDQGSYKLILGTDAHTDAAVIPFTLGTNIQYANDTTTGTKVENQFEDADDRLNERFSRADFKGTFPKPADEEDKTADSALMDALYSISTNNPNVSSYTMPETGKENTEGLTLRDLLYDENGNFTGKADYDDPRWDTLLDCLTTEDYANLFNNGCFHTEAITSIGKPETLETDGPAGFTNFINPDLAEGYSYCSEPVMAATWSKEALYNIGRAIGEEGLWGNTESGGYTYSGIYAPGVNIHRSPFGGRNGEYFSEDSFLTGFCAANEINGAADKGVYMTIKHFAVNEQETKRSVTGLVNWIDEQSLREIYLKPFEIAVKNSDATAVMSSFTRIGTTWCGGDYRLLTEVLRDEWGFRGFVICDFNTNSYMSTKQMVYAGGDLNLSSTRFWSKYSSSKAADVTVLRQAAKNILYSVVNSNAMAGEIIGYKMSSFNVALIIGDSCYAAVVLAAGLLLFLLDHKSANKQDLTEKQESKEAN